MKERCGLFCTSIFDYIFGIFFNFDIITTMVDKKDGCFLVLRSSDRTIVGHTT